MTEIISLISSVVINLNPECSLHEQNLNEINVIRRAQNISQSSYVFGNM